MDPSLPLRHALVVGGTGMLRDAALWLGKHFAAVSVVARDAARLKQLALESEGRIHALPTDYANRSSFRLALRSSVESHGSVELALAWLHEDGLDALPDLLGVLSHQPQTRLFLLHGSAEAAPRARVAPQIEAIRSSRPGIIRRIILGWKPGYRGSRWLNHTEISSGVCEAINADQDLFVVGNIRPWEDRP